MVRPSGSTVQYTRYNRTKFDHVVALLSPGIATEVRDLTLTPPTDNPQLIKWTAASE